MTPNTRGEVITFYSYKGGTGRSMALANVACLLAQRDGGKRVLVIDWDLEAPGLHRYFNGRTSVSGGDPEKREGLVDLMWRLSERFRVASDPGAPPLGPEQTEAVLDEITLADYFVDVDHGKAGPPIHLVKAGRFNSGYPKKVTTMPWEPLFLRAQGLFPALAERFARDHDYVLIDSRTGLTDVSGICTMLMPERLVLVFTPNQQSLSGVLDLAEKAITYRRGTADLRPLILYPLPSRIDEGESDLRKHWRGEANIGYQPRFERTFQELYELDECNLQSYFDRVQIPYKSRYSYGEEVAVLIDRAEDSLSPVPHYINFTERLLSDAEPWEDPAVVAARPQSNAVRAAEEFLSRQDPATRDLLWGALLRLVRPAGDGEESDSLLITPLDEFPEPIRALLKRAVRLGVIAHQQDSVQLADTDLPKAWPEMKARLDADRPFLRWRETLRRTIAEWKKAPGPSWILTGERLTEAARWLAERPQELNAAERLYLAESQRAHEKGLAASLAAAAATEILRAPTQADALSRAVLFAAESVRFSHTLEGDRALRDALALTAPCLKAIASTEKVDFVGTRVDQLLLSITSGNSVRLWPDAVGPEGPRVTLPARITGLAKGAGAGRIVCSDATGAIWRIDDDGKATQVAMTAPGVNWIEFDSKDHLLAVQDQGAVFEVDIDTGKVNVLVTLRPIKSRRTSVNRRFLYLGEEGSRTCLVRDAENPATFESIDLPGPGILGGFSSDGNLLAVSSEGVLSVWDRGTRSVVAQHRVAEPVNRIVFAPGDMQVLTLSGERTVQVFPIQSRTPAWRLRVETPVRNVAANSNAGLLALAGADGYIRLIDFASGREALRADHGAPVQVVRFFASGARLVSTGEDGSVRVWDVKAQREYQRLPGADWVWDVNFDRAGQYLACAGGEGDVSVWRVDGSEKVASAVMAGTVTSVSFAPDGSKVAAACVTGEAQVYSWPGLAPVNQIKHANNCSSVAFSPDGKRLITASWDSTVRVTDLTAWSKVLELSHDKTVWHAVMDATGAHIATASEDGAARIWDASSGMCVHRFDHGKPVRAVAFDPQGEFLAAACQDGTATLHPLAGGNDVVLAHGSALTCVAYSPDGNYLVTTGSDDTARIWPRGETTCTAEVRHEGELLWAAFSPDGRLLATAGADNMARVWLWRTADLVREACRRVHRNLSPAEWSQAAPGVPYRVTCEGKRVPVLS
jgi:WD40 repeat protein/cellulose biosynthesis protein BcsQ